MRRRLALSVPFVLAALVACQDTSQPIAPPEESLASRGSHPAHEVQAWFQSASPQVMALPQTVFAAHDEASGVLVFGVENNAAMAAVQAELARRGVPATAYRLQVTEPIHFMNTTLRTEHRPTVGGIQIHWSSYVCTLGFNVDHAGGRSFITNSHCTDQQGTTGNTRYDQPVRTDASSIIAFEADDPVYVRGGGCSVGKVCRSSDAARALYQAGVQSSRGGIAKTTGVNNGSLVVNGSFTITAQDNTTTNYSGTIHKVGRTTGWSSGNVTSTCATVNVSGSNIQLRCQTLVQRSGSVIVQGGDSGSPVFRITSGDNVQLVGILWGGSTSGDLFVFSPLKNIQDELGPVTATSGGDDPPPPPPPPSDPLVASFTYNCGNGTTCSFTDTSTGGPTGWSWSFAGGSPSSASSPNASTTYSSVGDHQVTLEVTRNGEADTATATINCRQQGPHLRCR
jgi:PKD repeat protein